MSANPIRALVAALAVSLLASAVVVRADDPPTKPAGSGSIDDDLSKSLGSDPLDDPAAPDAAQPAPAQPATKPAEPNKAKATGDPLDEELLKGLEDPATDPATSDEQNPLVKLNRRMREVEKRIAAAKSDRQTQEMQQQVLRELDALIKQCQKQQSKPSGSKPSPSQQTAKRDAAKQPSRRPGDAASDASKQAAKDSSKEINPTKTERPDLADMEKLIKDGVWGQLPAHLREQMLQSSVDQFLPKYQVLIEEYFKSIASGKQDR